MQLFTNEFGDAIRWRVALAGALVVVASTGLSLALFAGVPTDATEPQEAYGGYVFDYVPTEHPKSPQEASQGLTDTPEAAGDAESATTTETATPDERHGDALAWLEGAGDSPLLRSLTTDAAGALHASVNAWATSAGAPEDAPVAATLEEAEATPEGMRVRLSVDVGVGGTARTLDATLVPGGTWQLAELAAPVDQDLEDSPTPTDPATPVAPATPAAPEAAAPVDPTGVPAAPVATPTPAPTATPVPVSVTEPEPAPAPEPAALPATVAVADAALLSQVVGESVATGLQAQLLATGLPGAERAWTAPASVRVEGGVCRLTLWLPAGAGEPDRFEATFDAGVGLLEIWPATGTEGVA